jgi:hypothetical protein
MKSFILAVIGIVIILIIIKGGFIPNPRKYLTKKKIIKELAKMGIHGELAGDRYQVQLEDLAPIWANDLEEAEPLPFPKPKPEEKSEEKKTQKTATPPTPVNPLTGEAIGSVPAQSATGVPAAPAAPVTASSTPQSIPYEWISINKLVAKIHSIANIDIGNNSYAAFTHNGTAYVHRKGLLNIIKEMAVQEGVKIPDDDDDIEAIYEYIVDEFRKLGLVDAIQKGDTYYKYNVTIKGKSSGKTPWVLIPLKADIFADTESRKTGDLLMIESVVKKS